MCLVKSDIIDSKARRYRLCVVVLQTHMFAQEQEKFLVNFHFTNIIINKRHVPCCYYNSVTCSNCSSIDSAKRLVYEAKKV